jgi:hypothetical protein
MGVTGELAGPPRPLDNGDEVGRKALAQQAGRAVAAAIVINVEMLDPHQPVEGNPFQHIGRLVAQDGAEAEVETGPAAQDEIGAVRVSDQPHGSARR